jgi:dihydroxyacid dehydratase/phosphogluconate dehydratase
MLKASGFRDEDLPMKASLISCEVIADSIELVSQGQLFDAVIALAACDKTLPGTAMALIRLNVPSLVLYGGSIAPGRFRGQAAKPVRQRGICPLSGAERLIKRTGLKSSSNSSEIFQQ